MQRIIQYSSTQVHKQPSQNHLQRTKKVCTLGCLSTKTNLQSLNIRIGHLYKNKSINLVAYANSPRCNIFSNTKGTSSTIYKCQKGFDISGLQMRIFVGHPSSKYDSCEEFSTNHLHISRIKQHHLTTRYCIFGFKFIKSNLTRVKN